MKKIFKDKDYLANLIAEAQTHQNRAEITPEIIPNEAELVDQPEQEDEIQSLSNIENIEEEVWEDEEEVWEDAEKDITVATEGEQDDKEEGFSDPLYLDHGGYRTPISAEFDLNIAHESQYEYEQYLQIFSRRQEITPSTTCCVQNAPITLTFNGKLIYTGFGDRPAFNFATMHAGHDDTKPEIPSKPDSQQGENGGDCCCEVPPPPEPNYWFTYTNCDGEAYIDLFIKMPIRTELQSLDNGENYPSYEIESYRIHFYPGLEPECGCDITQVFSDVLIADSVTDFISGGGDRGSEHSTHFVDACGWCWSIVVGNPFDQGGGKEVAAAAEREPLELTVVPFCIQQIEIDTICSYETNVNNQLLIPNSPFLRVNQNSFASYNDGNYYNSGYVSLMDVNTGQELAFYSFSSSYSFDFQFVEFQGNSLLAFNFSQSYNYNFNLGQLTETEFAILYDVFDLPFDLPDNQGSYFENNDITFLIDLPDNIDFEDSYIEQFILCNPLYNDIIQNVVQGQGGIDSFNEFIQNGTISDSDSLDLATQVLQSFTVDDGYGVFEDNNNNTYQLTGGGSGLVLTPFILLGQTPDNAYNVHNVFIQNEQQANITNIDLEICYCGSDIEARYAEWQAVTGCDSDFGNPFAFVEQYISAHFVDDGNQKYLEFNFPMLTNFVGDGYWQAENQTFRVCLENIDGQITEMCIDTEALFQGYYRNGYVDFASLLGINQRFDNFSIQARSESFISFKDENGNCYELKPTELRLTALDGKEGSFYCPYELAPCECLEPIRLGLINLQPDTQVSSTDNSFTLFNTYTFSFEYFHDNDETYIDFSYQVGGEEAQVERIVIPEEFNLDCCCGIEQYLIDIEEFAREFLVVLDVDGDGDIDDEPLTARQVLEQVFMKDGNIAFLDCEKECYNLGQEDLNGDGKVDDFVLAHAENHAHVPLTLAIETLDEMGMPQISPLENTGCFDQFFDIAYVECNDVKYIDLTWHHTGFFRSTLEVEAIEAPSPEVPTVPSPADCFNFPAFSETIRISISDELNSCDINQIVLTPESYAELNAYFQDCCELADFVNGKTGLDLVTLMDRLDVEFRNDYGECFEINAVTLSNGSVIYELEPCEMGIACLMPNIDEDENNLVNFDFGLGFEAALNQANTGGGLSLREAVILSNNFDYMSDGSTNLICLDKMTYFIESAAESSTLDATTGDYDILNDVIIKGVSKEDSVINANELDRVFQVEKEVTLTLSDLSVTNGTVNDLGGGGILSLGMLNMTNVTVVDNHVINPETSLQIFIAGGGIYMTQGTIKDSIILGNSIVINDENIDINQARGGALYIDQSASIINSEILSNSITMELEGSIAEGGGIYGNNIEIDLSDIIKNIAEVIGDQSSALGGGLNLTNSIVNNSLVECNGAWASMEGNGAGVNGVSAIGGGLYLNGNNLVTNSTISFNNTGTTVINAFGESGLSGGGGIYSFGDNNRIINSTVYRNSSYGENPVGQVNGGGIYNAGNSMFYLANLTVVLNSVNSNTDIPTHNGDGIFNTGSGTEIWSTIAVGNSLTPISGGGVDVANAINNAIGTHNLFESVFVGGGLSFTISNYSTTFGSNLLANNGGPTPTVALIPSSPAIDQGLAGNSGDADELVDQRGTTYVNGPDIGAFEFIPTVPPIVLDLNRDGEITLLSPTQSLINLANLLGEGASEDLHVGWVGPQDGFLMYDPLGSGQFTDINQISFVGYSEGAKTDLEGLRGFDTNHNNQLDVDDAEYDSFGVWQDKNTNAQTDIGEYTTLKMLGITSLSLISDNHNVLSEGNIVFGESTYRTVGDEEFKVADVGLVISSGETLTTDEVVKSEQPIDFASIENETTTVATNAVDVPASDVTHADNDAVTVAVPPAPTVPEIEEQPTLAA